MPKAQHRTEILEKAKAQAKRIVQARKRLRTLLDKAKQGGDLSVQEKTEIRNLLRQINDLKQAIAAEGLDPRQAVSSLSVPLKKPGAKGRRKGKGRSGIGMYGLGPTIKIWR